ncbi:MAG: Pyrroline-5-carboxylate reductase [Syntrophorhabdus sp. PtaB.Bin047]|jgi:pyrroline-5-carboxylate reductase|nr:MAG: Pyrroline-5-carboxylate reductase [Syntrophorhabdus sp. PtaB.Bin047]
MDKVGIVGVGNMGESVLRALMQKGVKKDDLCFVEAKKDRALHIGKTYGIKDVKKVRELAKRSDLIVVAVKPQDARKVLPDVASSMDASKVLVSIMAGVTMANIIALAGRSVKVIRMMPNIAVKVGQGVIGVAAGADVSQKEVSEVKDLFSSAGLTVDVGEELMDAVTSLGASSPAFFLLFLEAMIDGGVKTGIPRDKARAISLQVIKGTIAMLEEENVHPALMREMITSPGGTTISGLAALEDKAFRGSVIEAIEKAAKRAKELSL